MKDNKKDRTRAVIVGLIYCGAMVMAFLSYKHSVLPYLATLLVVAAMAFNQFLQISKDSPTRSIITNILTGIMLVLLAISIVIEINKANINDRGTVNTTSIVVINND